MQITVEFYGIARARAGTATASVTGHCLKDVLLELSARYPRLAETCLDGSSLRPGYIVNLNGQRFLSDPETALRTGDVVMLLSMDAGG